jgi:peptidoglycan hydrolase-like protein with peptidoglycan-binding domain
MKTLTTTILATLLTVTFANAQVVATSTIACPQITKILSLGARDRAPETQVTELQQYLRSYYRLTDNELLVSGIFGKITRSYVRNFQRDNNLIVSGVVGQPTRAAILARCNGTFAAPAKSASASSSALPISGTQPITNTTNKVSAGGLLSGIRDYASRALNTATPPQKSTQISTTSVTPLQKCSVSGLSMESGSKVKFYLRASADASQGQSCASGSQVRECINGILSGSDAYMTTTCVDVTSAPKSQASNTTAPSNTLDFGGMYGYAVGGVVYTNPATGGASCPSGYTSSPVLGTTGLDYPLYVCTKQTSAGVKPVFDFGGMYGYAVGGVVYTNPATGGASCPSGYVSYPVFGSAGFDFPVYMCYRTSTGVGNSIFNFGGMYGLGI